MPGDAATPANSARSRLKTPRTKSTTARTRGTALRSSRTAVHASDPASTSGVSHRSAGFPAAMKHGITAMPTPEATASARALKPGGRVVVVEMLVSEDGSPSMAPRMDLNMLVMLPGCERTEREHNALLQAAGLSQAKVTATHSPFSPLAATRAG